MYVYRSGGTAVLPTEVTYVRSQTPPTQESAKIRGRKQYLMEAEGHHQASLVVSFNGVTLMFYDSGMQKP